MVIFLKVTLGRKIKSTDWVDENFESEKVDINVLDYDHLLDENFPNKSSTTTTVTRTTTTFRKKSSTSKKLWKKRNFASQMIYSDFFCIDVYSCIEFLRWLNCLFFWLSNKNTALKTFKSRSSSCCQKQIIFVKIWMMTTKEWGMQFFVENAVFWTTDRN